MASPVAEVRSIEHQAVANALFGSRLVSRSGDVAGSELTPLPNLLRPLTELPARADHRLQQTTKPANR
jgi:hypothetical protein